MVSAGTVLGRDSIAHRLQHSPTRVPCLTRGRSLGSGRKSIASLNSATYHQVIYRLPPGERVRLSISHGWRQALAMAAAPRKAPTIPRPSNGRSHRGEDGHR